MKAKHAYIWTRFDDILRNMYVPMFLKRNFVKQKILSKKFIFCMSVIHIFNIFCAKKLSKAAEMKRSIAGRI